VFSIPRVQKIVLATTVDPLDKLRIGLERTARPVQPAQFRQLVWRTSCGTMTGLVDGQYQLRNQNKRVVKTRHSSACYLSSVVLCGVLAHNKKHHQASEDARSNIS
jgi:hypothetical protein